MNKLLTVIVPTYKAEAYLDKCLTSLILKDQELMKRLEVLVINDGSPDGSREIALKYTKQYPDTFRIIDKENGGHGSGINTGSRQAQGLFFKVLDADDWVDEEGFPNFMTEIRRIAEGDAADIPDALVTYYKEYNILTQKTESYCAKLPDYQRNYNLEEVMDQWYLCHCDLHFWGISYNTQFYQKLGYDLLEGVFYEDQEYATVPFSYAEKIRFIDQMVYVYRVGDVNQSVFGDTQVRRRSHLEKVLERLLAQETNKKLMPPGGERYWAKKTTMNITGYYQIMMIKNRDKKGGRQAAEELNALVRKKTPELWDMVARKYKGFVWANRLHMSNRAYEFWLPRTIHLVRRLKGIKEY